MRVLIQKVDLDTALTAVILDITEADDVEAVRDQADSEDLANPDVICIECGGSGQVDLQNFDHHDTDTPLPPACVQAYHLRGDDPEATASSVLAELVDYVAVIDTEGPERLKQQASFESSRRFPTLSDVFAGMLLCRKDPVSQLIAGMSILRIVLARGWDPFGRLPTEPEWQPYTEAKQANDRAIEKALATATFLETDAGRQAGFVETDVMGALGALYHHGCEVVIAYGPQFGTPPTPKYTIAGNDVRVDGLLPALNEREPGWGGPAHGTILGSPRGRASQLSPREILEIVREHL